MAIKKYTNGSWVPASYRKYGTETDTITTLPVTIIGDGTPISSYTIKGNMEQSGAPTPSSPIYPSECGEKTENLFDGEMESGYYDNNGEKQSNPNWIRCKNLINADSNTTYHVIIDTPGGTYGSVVFARCYDANGEYIGTTSQTVIQYYKEYAFTTLNNTKFISFYVSVDYIDMKIAFYQTTISGKPYEPYGYKLPLTLGSTTTDIYLGEVQSERRIKKLVLTGQETYQNYSYASTNGVQIINMFETAYRRASGLCNIYPVSTVAGSTSCVWIGSGGGDRNLYFVGILSDMGMSTADEFKSYVQQQYAAGTPVTVWYVLETPETAVVNEPIRKIGDYVDSVSGTNLATSGTAQEFDVGTTLKPSEVDMTYHGWHEHEDTKYST